MNAQNLTVHLNFLFVCPGKGPAIIITIHSSHNADIPLLLFSCQVRINCNPNLTQTRCSTVHLRFFWPIDMLNNRSKRPRGYAEAWSIAGKLFPTYRWLYHTATSWSTAWRCAFLQVDGLYGLVDPLFWPRFWKQGDSSCSPPGRQDSFMRSGRSGGGTFT